MQPPALSGFQREPKPSQAKEDIISPPTHNNSESELCHSSTKYHNLHTHVYLQQIMIHLLDNTYLSFKYLVLLFLFTITQDHIISTPASTQPPNF